MKRKIAYDASNSLPLHRPMEWKRDASRTFRPIVPLYRLFRALACTLGEGGTKIKLKLVDVLKARETARRFRPPLGRSGSASCVPVPLCSRVFSAYETKSQVRNQS
ncbi:hypothetical protein EVAR_70069_1 [Eumeta japonica]|uniref:Uncharacterized protein n=1 Tax=Eumeta variegata TaxID=151549 RepID=A0A4C1ZX18_EUMVA|nr:hypothetical protein EVAR_70069_1 [Eumeta japonica]